MRSATTCRGALRDTSQHSTHDQSGHIAQMPRFVELELGGGRNMPLRDGAPRPGQEGSGTLTSQDTKRAAGAHLACTGSPLSKRETRRSAKDSHAQRATSDETRRDETGTRHTVGSSRRWRLLSPGHEAALRSRATATEPRPRPGGREADGLARRSRRPHPCRRP